MFIKRKSLNLELTSFTNSFKRIVACDELSSAGKDISESRILSKKMIYNYDMNKHY